MCAAPQPISPILCEDRIRSRIGEVGLGTLLACVAGVRRSTSKLSATQSTSSKLTVFRSASTRSAGCGSVPAPRAPTLLHQTRPQGAHCAPAAVNLSLEFTALSKPNTPPMTEPNQKPESPGEAI